MLKPLIIRLTPIFAVDNVLNCYLIELPNLNIDALPSRAFLLANTNNMVRPFAGGRDRVRAGHLITMTIIAPSVICDGDEERGLKVVQVLIVFWFVCFI
jgi:hypothetical protein